MIRWNCTSGAPLRQVRCRRRVDLAGERREPARVGVPGLVGAVDAPDALGSEVDAGLAREALVEDQRVAPHVDLTLGPPPAGDREWTEDVDRRSLALDQDAHRDAGPTALRE